MNFKKIIFSTLSLLLITSMGLLAQTSTDLIPEKMDRDVFDAPTYKIESVTFEELGFPIAIPAQNLGYEYVLIWEEKEAPKKNKVYGAESLDQMPLFTSDCINAANKATCSNNALNKYMSENIDYPEKALAKDHDGVEKLFFILDEQGKIEGNIKVISKDKPCKGCAMAAVEAVANMPAWVPGMKDGKAVKTKVILPVRFNTL